MVYNKKYTFGGLFLDCTQIIPNGEKEHKLRILK